MCNIQTTYFNLLQKITICIDISIFLKKEGVTNFQQMFQKPNLMPLSVLGQKLFLEEFNGRILIHMTYFYNFLAFKIFKNFHRQVMQGTK